MKKIMMTKYGFVRWPEEDFSDDGNRFYCFKVGDRVRVSKLVSDGNVYISARIDGPKLPYEVYSQLEHYKALDYLNGCSLGRLTEQDLIDLYDACVAYEQEYNEAEKNLKMPSVKEIKEQCKKLLAVRVLEFTKAEQMVAQNISALASTLSEYSWKYLQKHLTTLKKRAEEFDIDKYSNFLYDTRRSIDFCKPDSYDFNESWDYKEVVRLVTNISSKF